MFLNQMQLLDERCAPVGLSGLVAHLFYHEPAVFLLVHLLQTGVLKPLIDKFATEPASAAQQLMGVLARVFLTQPLRRDDEARSPSVVCLGDIAQDPDFERAADRQIARDLGASMEDYDRRVTRLYTSILVSASHALPEREAQLPLSGQRFPLLSPGQLRWLQEHQRDHTPRTVVDVLTKQARPSLTRSPFVALNGAADTFAHSALLLEEVCTCVRRADRFRPRTRVRQQVRPALQLFGHLAIPSGGKLTFDRRGLPFKLNAYALDFYKVQCAHRPCPI